MFSRLKQGYRYLFKKFDKSNEYEIRSILTVAEFQIFSKMGEYDKLHSFLIYTRCKKDEILRNDINYLKLALLHDCGKGNIGLLKRIKKVLVGDKELERHAEKAFEKLKDINIDLAKLCRDHHEKIVENKMKIFQKLDDE